MELLGELREREQVKQQGTIPFIAISAHVYNEEVECYLAAGFDGYLPKPLDKDALCQLIQSHLEGKTLLTEAMPCEPEPETAMTEQLLNERIIQDDLAVLGKAKMQQIITLFVDGSDEMLHQLSQAEESGNSTQIKQIAHKLKGSAGSLGLSALHDICMKIEKGTTPLEAYQQRKDALVDVVQQSKLALLAAVS